MNYFKAQLEADLTAVFLNGAEFAEPHTVAGVTVSAITDSDLVSEYNAGAARNAAPGVYVARLCLLMHASALPARPLEDQIITVDGVDYLVLSSEVEAGLLCLMLGGHRS